MNYFEIMGFPVSFELDKELLRKRYYENSKKFHPDFHTLSDQNQQEEVLRLSTLNNLAYNTLNDFDKRLKYVLELTGTIEKEEKYKLSPSFLFEVMEINEALMELEIDQSIENYKKIEVDLRALEKDINDSIINCIHRLPLPKESDEELLQLKDLYYRKRYLLRIQENLDKFAPPE